MRRKYNRIKRVVRRGEGSTVESVLVRDKNGGWKRVSNREEMEHAILEQNKAVLKSSEETPFGMDPLRSIIGDYSENKGAEDILSGKFEGAGLDVPGVVMEWIRMLKGEV